ncbi:MAG: hypothetical protein FWD60_04890 [Candidatus Azobacteroides sp.]|nr:hypothetical protein [Candidatus Azobacteroides sp.]
METNKAMNRTNAPDTRERYEAPVIEIVEIKVEQGFQMSGYDSLKEKII